MADGPLYQSPDESAGRARAELEALPAGRGPPVEQPASVPHWRAVLGLTSTSSCIFRGCDFGVAGCGLLRSALGAVQFFHSLASEVSSFCIGRGSALVSLESKGFACWSWQIDILRAAFMGCLHEHVWSRIFQIMTATYCTMLDLLGFHRISEHQYAYGHLQRRAPCPMLTQGHGGGGSETAGATYNTIPAVKFQIPVVPALVMTSL